MSAALFVRPIPLSIAPSSIPPSLPPQIHSVVLFRLICHATASGCCTSSSRPSLALVLLSVFILLCFVSQSLVLLSNDPRNSSLPQTPPHTPLREGEWGEGRREISAGALEGGERMKRRARERGNYYGIILNTAAFKDNSNTQC